MMKIYAVSLTAVCLISGLFFVTSWAVLDYVVAQPQPKLDQPRQFSGRVVELPSDRLPRFKQPIQAPPKNHPHPPQRPGGNWHWHPNRGHVWLPGPIVSPTFVLPPTYQLPQRVYYYEQPAASYVICPHCNQRIILE